MRATAEKGLFVVMLKSSAVHTEQLRRKKLTELVEPRRSFSLELHFVSLFGVVFNNEPILARRYGDHQRDAGCGTTH